MALSSKDKILITCVIAGLIITVSLAIYYRTAPIQHNYYCAENFVKPGETWCMNTTQHEIMVKECFLKGSTIKFGTMP